MSEPPKKVSRRAFLPVIGLIFGALVLALSYGLAPLALEGIGMINEEWSDRLYETEAVENANGTTETEEVLIQEYQYLMTLVLFFVLMALSTTIVAGSIGKDPQKESMKASDYSYSPANKKAVEKRLRRDLREAKRRAKQKKSQRK